MKRIIQLWAAVVLAAAAGASPLQKKQVPADAKWLLHLDMDQFRTSQVGDAMLEQGLEKFIRERLEEGLSEERLTLKGDLGIDLDLNRINGATMYGTDYEPNRDGAGVLIKTDLDFQVALYGAITKSAEDGGTGRIRIEERDRENGLIYEVNKSLFISLLPGDRVALSRTLFSAKKEAAVLAGKSPNLMTAAPFRAFRTRAVTRFSSDGPRGSTRMRPCRCSRRF